MEASDKAGSENDLIKWHRVKRHWVLFKLPYWDVSEYDWLFTSWTLKLFMFFKLAWEVILRWGGSFPDLGRFPSKSTDRNIFSYKNSQVLTLRMLYLQRLLVCHVLNVMHYNKNIAENLFSTLLGMMDGPAVRNDMKEAGCKKSLHIVEANTFLTGFYVPRAHMF